MLLGSNSAQLIYDWIHLKQVEISHLDLSFNKLDDDGIKLLAPAIAKQKSIISLDLRQNKISQRCSNAFYTMLADNESLVELNLGSIASSYPNRLMREPIKAIA